ncbi:MAG: shikimate 5-dehydrogenase [Anaerolineaceae bacterium]|nr:shikimate 5-dehydrogenase [Anaerolineaceae bacterium]
MNDFRLTLNKDTQLCMSLAARPGNFGTRLHNFLYARLKLNYVYKSFTTHDLKHAVAGIRALGIRGCAVSMPFKEEVIAYLDQIEPSAARISAVNTIVNDGGVLTGLNTDYIAIQRVFDARAIPPQSRIGVFGSGGMAKAIVSALDDAGYRQVTITARNEKTGQPLAEKYGYRWQAEWRGEDAFDVLVNATPVGMAPDENQCPFPAALIRSAGCVVDSVANPIQTRLIETASRFGKTTVNGFEITLIQSIEQFKLYTGVTPDEASIQAGTDFVLSAF